MLRLFEWINGAYSFVPVDKWPVFEGNVIVKLFFRHGKPYILYQSLLLSTIILKDIAPHRPLIFPRKVVYILSANEIYIPISVHISRYHSRASAILYTYKFLRDVIFKVFVSKIFILKILLVNFDLHESERCLVILKNKIAKMLDL